MSREYVLTLPDSVDDREVFAVSMKHPDPHMHPHVVRVDASNGLRVKPHDKSLMEMVEDGDIEPDWKVLAMISGQTEADRQHVAWNTKHGKARA